MDGLGDPFAAATSCILPCLLLLGIRWHEARKQMAYYLEHSAASNSMLALTTNFDCSLIYRDFQASTLSRFGLKSVHFGFFELSQETDSPCCVYHLQYLMDSHQFDGFFPAMLSLVCAHSYDLGLLCFVDLIPYFGVDIIINVEKLQLNLNFISQNKTY